MSLFYGFLIFASFNTPNVVHISEMYHMLTIKARSQMELYGYLNLDFLDDEQGWVYSERIREVEYGLGAGLDPSPISLLQGLFFISESSWLE